MGKRQSIERKLGSLGRIGKKRWGRVRIKKGKKGREKSKVKEERRVKSW